MIVSCAVFLYLSRPLCHAFDAGHVIQRIQHFLTTSLADAETLDAFCRLYQTLLEQLPPRELKALRACIPCHVIETQHRAPSSPRHHSPSPPRNRMNDAIMYHHYDHRSHATQGENHPHGLSHRRRGRDVHDDDYAIACLPKATSHTRTRQPQRLHLRLRQWARPPPLWSRKGDEKQQQQPKQQQQVFSPAQDPKLSRSHEKETTLTQMVAYGDQTKCLRHSIRTNVAEATGTKARKMAIDDIERRNPPQRETKNKKGKVPLRDQCQTTRKNALENRVFDDRDRAVKHDTHNDDENDDADGKDAPSCLCSSYVHLDAQLKQLRQLYEEEVIDMDEYAQIKAQMGSTWLSMVQTPAHALERREYWRGKIDVVDETAWDPRLYAGGPRVVTPQEKAIAAASSMYHRQKANASKARARLGALIHRHKHTKPHPSRNEGPLEGTLAALTVDEDVAGSRLKMKRPSSLSPTALELSNIASSYYGGIFSEEQRVARKLELISKTLFESE